MSPDFYWSNIVGSGMGALKMVIFGKFIMKQKVEIIQMNSFSASLFLFR